MCIRDRPIGKNQLIQEHITDMYLKIENMRNGVYKTAWKIDNGESVQILSLIHISERPIE